MLKSKLIPRAAVAAILTAGLVVAATPANATWFTTYTNNTAKQGVFLGNTSTATITSTSASISGWALGDAVNTYARSGSSLIGSSTGWSAAVVHPGGVYTSAGKWVYVLDPSDPGTMSLTVKRDSYSTGGMRVSSTATGSPSAELSVLESPESGDLGLDEELTSTLAETIDLDSVRQLGEIDGVRYWAGVSLEGDIVLIAQRPDGVSGIGYATPEQFARGGLVLRVEADGETSAPAYLVPDDAASAVSRQGLDAVSPNLFTGAGSTLQATSRSTVGGFTLTPLLED